MEKTLLPTSADVTGLRRKIIRSIPDAKIRRTRGYTLMAVTVEKRFCVLIFTAGSWRLGPEDGFPVDEYCKLLKILGGISVL